MSGVEKARRRLVLVLGGARSGKSAYAEALARQVAGAAPVLYIATAQANDDEMRQRIARHQAERPAHWVTREAPTDPAAALREPASATSPDVALLDCVTLFVSNVIVGVEHAHFDEGSFDADAAESRVSERLDALLDAYHTSKRTLIVVSNEVGMGVVPPYPLGRIYRDVLGRVNARLAAAADDVVLMVAGLPIEVKALSAAWRATVDERYGRRGE